MGDFCDVKQGGKALRVRTVSPEQPLYLMQQIDGLGMRG